MIEVGKKVLFKFKDKKVFKQGTIISYPTEEIVNIQRNDFEEIPFIVKLDEIDLVEIGE